MPRAKALTPVQADALWMQLKPAQKAFLKACLAGQRPADAYAQAYPFSKETTWAKKADALLRTHKIISKLWRSSQTNEVNRQMNLAERTLAALEAQAFGDPRALFDADGKPLPLHKLDDATAAAISEIEIGGDGVHRAKISRGASLQTLAKISGLHKETATTLQVAVLTPRQRSERIYEILQPFMSEGGEPSPPITAGEEKKRG